MDLYFTLYRSKARKPITQEMTFSILTSSMRNNHNEGLTGFLHTDHGYFLQFLEGPRGPLLRKLARIQKDRRHTDFVILAEGDIEERLFPDWDMGQITSDLLEATDDLQNRSWLRPAPDIDPLNLLNAFAAYSGNFDQILVEAK